MRGRGHPLGSRPADEVEEWLEAHGSPDLPVTNVKSHDVAAARACGQKRRMGTP
jgi:hypothetical protein